MKEIFGYFSLKNIKRGPLTTLLGVAICWIALQQHTPGMWNDTVIGLGVGLFLLFMPDEKKPKGTNGAATLILLLMLSVSLSSCISYPRCVSKYGLADLPDSVQVKIDTVLKTQYISLADSLTHSLDLDSLLIARLNDTLQVVSESGRARAAFWRNQYNQLQTRLDCLPDTVYKTDTLQLAAKAKVPEPAGMNPEPPPTTRQWIWNHYKEFAAYAFLVLLAAIMIASKVFNRR